MGIGPAGLGGRVTALAVNVEMMPCHIASLPVAVNIQCHVARHKRHFVKSPSAALRFILEVMRRIRKVRYTFSSRACIRAFDKLNKCITKVGT